MWQTSEIRNGTNKASEVLFRNFVFLQIFLSFFPNSFDPFASDSIVSKQGSKKTRGFKMMSLGNRNLEITWINSAYSYSRSLQPTCVLHWLIYEKLKKQNSGEDSSAA